MKQIPNLFTLINLIFGCLSIVFTLQNGLQIAGTDDVPEIFYIPEKLWLGSLFIGLAAVIDFLDGFIARIFKAQSPMGEQLDSLSDLVSFGVAPSIILYQFLRHSLSQENDGLDASFIFLLPAFIIAIAAAWRLARFNLDKTQSYSFRGLPVPAAGMFIASFPLIFWNVNEAWVRELLLNKWFLYAVILLLSWLMVSRLPLMAMKFKDFSIQNNLAKYLLILIAIVLLVLLKWLAIPLIIVAYVLLSLLFKSKTA